MLPSRAVLCVKVCYLYSNVKLDWIFCHTNST